MNSHDDPRENPAIADILARKAADRRISLSRRECQVEGGWAQSSQILKESHGLLRRYVDGSRIRVTTVSFYQHLLDLASRPARKVRRPSARFARRKPTQQELDGLKRGNEQRAKEARKRREAKAAAPAE
jgi:hypothetical protein